MFLEEEVVVVRWCLVWFCVGICRGGVVLEGSLLDRRVRRGKFYFFKIRNFKYLRLGGVI